MFVFGVVDVFGAERQIFVWTNGMICVYTVFAINSVQCKSELRIY